MVCSKMVAIRPHTHVGDFSYMAQPKLYFMGVCVCVKAGHFRCPVIDCLFICLICRYMLRCLGCGWGYLSSLSNLVSVLCT